MMSGLAPEGEKSDRNPISDYEHKERSPISECETGNRTSISELKYSGLVKPRQAVLSSQPYDAPMEGRARSIRFDFNESTEPIEGCYPEGLPAEVVSMYPEYGELLQKLAVRFELSPENFILTNGSDEAISLISNTFIEQGQDTALISTPCFFMIKQCLRLAGAILQEVSVDKELQFDLDEIDAQLKLRPKLAMFATPDNPTGSVIPTNTIETWCQLYPDVLIVIDEAYGEFAGTSVIPLINKYDNLLVLKTFSKAWGMAGFRLGMVVGNGRLIEFLKRVKLPYSVNSAAVFTAVRLLDREPDMAARVSETVRLRTRLAKFLDDRGYKVRETNANWCLLGTGFLATKFSEFTASKNLLVRNRSTSEFSRFADAGSSGSEQSMTSSAFEPMWGLIRISAGNADEVAVFEKIVDQFRDSYALIFDLDGTLVDTSKSFDKTVEYLVEKYSGAKLDLRELAELRREGGFNDDWVASRELLRRRGFDISLAEITRDGESFYLSIARDNEELLLPLSLLRQLRKRHPLFIVTGRTRAEYAPIWGERFDPLFERVYCVDDVPGCRAKPHPDYLLQVLKDSGITSGAYIGNAVDDMQAACAAGLTAIGVAEVLVGKPSTAGAAAGAELRKPSTAGAAAGSDGHEPTTTGAENFDEKESETSSSASEQHCQRTALIRAGAHAIISNCTELEELLMVSSAPQSSET